MIRNRIAGIAIAFFSLTVLVVAASAAQKYDKQDKQDKTEGAQANQGTENTAAPVVPPAPNIVKKDPNAVSIPITGSSNNSETGSAYEQKPAAELGVKVGSSFGYRRDPFTGREKFHTGLDIKAKWGDPVGASQIGTVQFAGWSNGYGNLIIVNHGGGITTHYAHLSSFAVEVGDPVERGTIVGYAGSTGRATSPHLHYEVRVDGNPVNPLDTIALDANSEYFVRTAGPPAQPEDQEPVPANKPAKSDVTPAKDAVPAKNAAPTKDAEPAKNAAPVKDFEAVENSSYHKVPRYAKDSSSTKNPAPAKDVAQSKNSDSGKDLTSAKNSANRNHKNQGEPSASGNSGQTTDGYPTERPRRVNPVPPQ
ncbi:MAG TPA: M23 family metallopeptidase [Blastocatellia bacterium]